MGKEALVKQMIIQFIGTVEQQMSALKEAVNTGGFETITHEAHAIKGGAANLTAFRLSRAARDLELEARSNRTDRGFVLLEALEGELERLKDFLRAKDIVV